MLNMWWGGGGFLKCLGGRDGECEDKQQAMPNTDVHLECSYLFSGCWRLQFPIIVLCTPGLDRGGKKYARGQWRYEFEGVNGHFCLIQSPPPPSPTHTHTHSGKDRPTLVYNSPPPPPPPPPPPVRTSPLKYRRGTAAHLASLSASLSESVVGKGSWGWVDRRDSEWS